MKIKTIIPQIPNYKQIFKEIDKCFKKKYLTNDGENLLKFDSKLQKYFICFLDTFAFYSYKSSYIYFLFEFLCSDNIKKEKTT